MTQDEIILYIMKTDPKPSLDEVMDCIDDLHADYTLLVKTLVTSKIAKAADFQSRLRGLQRRAVISRDLGKVPANPADLINAVLDTHKFEMDPASSTPLMWHCPIRGERYMFDIEYLRQVALDKNRNLLSGQFKDSEINAECQFLQTRMKEAVRSEITKKVTAPPAVAFDWSMLATTCFDLTEVPEHIVVAALQKFMWQVKRKLVGLPVTHHLMPVLFGSQGNGKTVFCTKMLEALGSLWTVTDFGRLTDNREAGLFENYVLFLDEMHKADRSEMEAVKAVITREFYGFRPMGTNMDTKRPQMSTFIGCSNKLLGQLINDPTGNRRFLQLDFKGGDETWDYVNSLDFINAWNSVDEKAEDPSKPYFDEMAELRKSAVNESSVGLFMKQLEENDGVYQVKTYDGVTYRSIGEDVMRKEDLFRCYRDYCDAMRIGKPMELQAFVTELRRMKKHDPAMPLRCGTARTAGYNGWQFTGVCAELPHDAKAVMTIIKGGK